MHEHSETNDGSRDDPQVGGSSQRQARARAQAVTRRAIDEPARTKLAWAIRSSTSTLMRTQPLRAPTFARRGARARPRAHARPGLRAARRRSSAQRLLAREWLVTNGLGGYAAGTIGGAPSRRYHGVLIAALPPPHGRRLLLSDVHEELLHRRRARRPPHGAHSRRRRARAPDRIQARGRSAGLAL